MRRIQLYVYKFLVDGKTQVYSPDLEIVKSCPKNAAAPELAEIFLPDIKVGKLLKAPTGWYVSRLKALNYLASNGYRASDLLSEVQIAYNYGREDE